MDIGMETKTHLNEHIKYPATGEEIKQQCNMMSHVPETERKMDMDMINSKKTYASADDVMKDLKM
jgi:hypothetical protein